MREAKLTQEQMDLFDQMNISEQASVKRLLWMISDVSKDEEAEGYQDLLESLFRGAAMKYGDSSEE